jgi:hypothetical protein
MGIPNLHVEKAGKWMDRGKEGEGEMKTPLSKYGYATAPPFPSSDPQTQSWLAKSLMRGLVSKLTIHNKFSLKPKQLQQYFYVTYS